MPIDANINSSQNSESPSIEEQKKNISTSPPSEAAKYIHGRKIINNVEKGLLFLVAVVSIGSMLGKGKNGKTHAENFIDRDTWGKTLTASEVLEEAAENSGRASDSFFLKPSVLKGIGGVSIFAIGGSIVGVAGMAARYIYDKTAHASRSSVPNK